ncbi:hypothetical protein BD410DRAFT_834336 [Rickenella mellea]|uniref:Hydrophobin n=1 Tax=Rickenella mellea TaxID=50990 RepID=A0A4R5XG53_9AGAM|nr:hypothetical protein BD410DRAFT_834336 [Rickenella mellea]
MKNVSYFLLAALASLEATAGVVATKDNIAAREPAPGCVGVGEVSCDVPPPNPAGCGGVGEVSCNRAVEIVAREPEPEPEPGVKYIP